MQAAAEKAGLIDWDGTVLDATHVKARRSGYGGAKKVACRRKKGPITDEWLGRQRGGITRKIHLCVDGHGLPLSTLVTTGQCSHAAQIWPVLDALCVPRPAGGDRGNVQPACG